jgi:hypothetical protein
MILLSDDKVLREALTSMGFRQRRRNPVLQIAGTVSFEETDIRRGPLVFMRYRTDIDIQDSNGNVLLSFSNTSREGHISFKEARNRIERSLHRNLSDFVQHELGAFFDRLATTN